MPTYDVPTEEGMVRVTASSPTEAARLVSAGKGVLLPRLNQPGAAQAPPGVYAEPQPPPNATVFNPGAPAAPRSQQAPLAGVFDRGLAAAGRFAGQAALPTAGSLVLGIGGQFLPGGSAVPPQVREGAGSLLGTGANMLLGIEEPSMEQLLLSAMIPASARGAGGLASRALPGAASARAAGLVEEVSELPRLLRQGITTPPPQLYGQAYTLNTPVALTQTSQVAQGLFRQEQRIPKGLRFESARAITNDLITLAQQHGSAGVPLEDLDEIRQRIGARIGTTTDAKEKGVYKQLYASLLRDIEATAAQQGGDGARLLLEGIRQQRREFAAQDLQELVTTATSRPRPVDGLQQVNFGALLKAIDNPRGHQQELLADFLTQHPQERAEIVSLLQDMNRRNVKLLPPSGTMFGSGMAIARGGAGFLGAQTLNQLAGTSIDPAAAGAATAFGSHLISRALLTPGGRGFLRQALAEGPTLNLTQLVFQLAGQGLRGSLGATPLSQGATALGLVEPTGAVSAPPPTRDPGGVP